MRAAGDAAEAGDRLEHLGLPVALDADEPDDLAGADAQVEPGDDLGAARIDDAQARDLGGDASLCAGIGAIDPQRDLAADHHRREALLGDLLGLDDGRRSCPAASP